jgi:hypothetical protein
MSTNYTDSSKYKWSTCSVGGKATCPIGFKPAPNHCSDQGYKNGIINGLFISPTCYDSVNENYNGYKIYCQSSDAPDIEVTATKGECKPVSSLASGLQPRSF